jgi:hypothetical protein
MGFLEVFYELERRVDALEKQVKEIHDGKDQDKRDNGQGLQASGPGRGSEQPDAQEDVCEGSKPQKRGKAGRKADASHH